ncbi:MAG: hypothetical protein AMXMBFR34_23820 [Myxococcaceae bacterium]
MASRTALKVAGCGVSTLSGGLLVLVGLFIVRVGQCAEGLGRATVEQDRLGHGTIVGAVVQAGGEGTDWLGWLVVLAGAFVLTVGVWFFVSLLRRGPVRGGHESQHVRTAAPGTPPR